MQETREFPALEVAVKWPVPYTSCRWTSFPIFICVLLWIICLPHRCASCWWTALRAQLSIRSKYRESHSTVFFQNKCSTNEITEIITFVYKVRLCYRCDVLRSRTIKITWRNTRNMRTAVWYFDVELQICWFLTNDEQFDITTKYLVSFHSKSTLVNEELVAGCVLFNLSKERNRWREGRGEKKGMDRERNTNKERSVQDYRLCWVLFVVNTFCLHLICTHTVIMFESSAKSVWNVRRDDFHFSALRVR